MDLLLIVFTLLIIIVIVVIIICVNINKENFSIPDAYNNDYYVACLYAGNITTSDENVTSAGNEPVIKAYKYMIKYKKNYEIYLNTLTGAEKCKQLNTPPPKIKLPLGIKLPSFGKPKKYKLDECEKIVKDLRTQFPSVYTDEIEKKKQFFKKYKICPYNIYEIKKELKQYNYFIFLSRNYIEFLKIILPIYDEKISEEVLEILKKDYKTSWVKNEDVNNIIQAWNEPEEVEKIIQSLGKIK